MRILLLGCGGQVGWELQRSLAPLGELTALDFNSDGPWKADFSRPESLGPMLQALRPALIVNAAAHTAVDRAETEPDLARRINATAVGELAAHAASAGALLVHYSTDYVFDGSGQHAREEDAPTGPLSVYGRTKLEGEQLIRDSGCDHLILRTSWVYAARGGNFARTMLKLAAERDSLKVVADQVGSPTGADLLADLTAHMARRTVGSRGLSGTYHVVADGHTSWFDYALHVVEWARQRGHPVRVARDHILGVPSTDYPAPAARPLNSRLSTRKLRETFDLHPPAWQGGVERMLAEVLGL